MNPRVLFVADGALLDTGFGVVARNAVPAFVRSGWDVHQLTCMDERGDDELGPYRELGITAHPVRADDLLGQEGIKDLVREIRPDAILNICDPGTAKNWQIVYKLHGIDVPTLLYAPVEGAPVHPRYMQAFEDADAPLTVTEWATRALVASGGPEIPYVWHGVDSDVFRPLEPYRRDKLRELWGWEDKFIITYVARNQGRKGHDRLIKAMAFLKQQGAVGLHLYLHCVPFEGYWNQGWDLAGVVHYAGVADMVSFRSTGPGKSGIIGESTGTLVEKLGCSDFYIHPAKVEGFGLPILEAASCGLPVAVTRDHGNMMEVIGDAAFDTIAVRDSELWFTGAELAHAHYEDIARVIWEAYKAHKAGKLAPYGQSARKRAKMFSWDAMSTRIEEACRALV